MLRWRRLHSHLFVTYFYLLCQSGSQQETDGTTLSKQFEELVKGQFITIMAGLRETKELGTAKHPRGASNS